MCKVEQIMLDAAIEHCEAVAEFHRERGAGDTVNGTLAEFLKRLRYYEAAIESGRLIWKEDIEQHD